MADDVRVVLNLAEIDAAVRMPEFRAYLHQTGEALARGLAAVAPRGAGRDGHGADAIHAGADGTDVVVDVDQLHAYMRIIDVGYQHAGARGRYHPGVHFSDVALDRYARP